MCDGGIVGVQNKDICCSLGCGECGGSGCSSAGGLSATECCTSTIRDSGVMCGEDADAAPCILSGETVMWCCGRKAGYSWKPKLLTS